MSGHSDESYRESSYDTVFSVMQDACLSFSSMDGFSLLFCETLKLQLFLSNAFM